MNSNENSAADCLVIAGPPGAGKSTVASLLLPKLAPAPALLDKDTMLQPLVDQALELSGHDAGERDNEFYNARIKPYEYKGLLATARQIRSLGCPVAVAAPLARQISNEAVWRETVNSLGGDRVMLIWVRSDSATLRQRMETRGELRDESKFRNWDEFVERVKPDSEPAIAHFEIDNRCCTVDDLNTQIEKLAVRLQ